MRISRALVIGAIGGVVPVLVISAWAACGPQQSTQALPDIPWEVTGFPEPHDPADNPSSPAKVALGMLLFYDPILGSDGETACATCHSEIWGMSDGLPKSIGVGGGPLTGPGRRGDAVGDRNAQSLWNVGFRGDLFWDGRAPSLEAQALMPMHNTRELAREPEAAVVAIGAVPEYRELFRAAFPAALEPITVDTMTKALAAFERSLISDRALYDSYVRGDLGAFTDVMVEGMELFGAAGCVECHVPPLFESRRYDNRGIGGDMDAGRFEVTGDPNDRGRFRVPSLRNSRKTEPYFHDGSVETLREAVAHEVALSPNGTFTDSDITAIYMFISKGLNDASRRPQRPTEVPSGLPVPLDEFRVPR